MAKAVVKSVDPGSIADDCGIEPGDAILTINGKKFVDILDFRYLTSDDYYVVEVEKTDGSIEEIEVENDLYEQFGCEFEKELIDEPMLCRNKCVFCFMDQLPPNMRKTMYFKDDDVRLSFLEGNYVTLTNLSEADIERICSLRVSPINVSVHVTDPALRCKMLNNRFAGELLKIMRRFADAVAQRCGGCCAVFAGADGSYKYAIGRPGGDLRPLVRELNAALTGRGGGKPEFVQGSVTASRAQIEAFFYSYFGKSILQ